MKIEGAKRLVEGSQIVRAPEDAEQAKRRVSARHDMPRCGFHCLDYQPNRALSRKKPIPGAKGAPSAFHGS